MSDDEEQPAAAAVGIKLPAFWPRKPSTWFAQAEAQFVLGNITRDKTKYFHVVAKLDQDTAERITDLLENPPSTDKFTTLKNRLTETFTKTPLQRAQDLLDISSLGDRKPSELMDTMLSMAGRDIQPTSPLFQAIFLRTLPRSVRQHLEADGGFDDPRKVAKLADRLLATAPEISPEVQRVQGRRQVGNKVTGASGFCFFHEKFAHKARKCRQPCSFKVRVTAVSEDSENSEESGNGQAGRC